MTDKLIMEESIRIRPCTADDVDTIIRLGIQTFIETFGDVNTKENMDSYLQSTFTPERIKEEFREAGSIFFLAEDNGTPVGFAKVRASKKPLELVEFSALEIERLYAVKRCIGRGIGKLLMQTCLDYAKRNGFEVVWLGVWEHNIRALEFYAKWGFEKFSAHTFMLGDDAQTDLLMKRKL
jgi:ribosomal protein S18 acetylase RimI-like enzyme